MRRRLKQHGGGPCQGRERSGTPADSTRGQEAIEADRLQARGHTFHFKRLLPKDLLVKSIREQQLITREGLRLGCWL